jgi:hypothetical protein
MIVTSSYLSQAHKPFLAPDVADQRPSYGAYLWATTGAGSAAV